MNAAVARATLVEASEAKGLPATTDAEWQELAQLACLDTWHARHVGTVRLRSPTASSGSRRRQLIRVICM